MFHRDGNGRMARAVGDLFLARADGSPQRFVRLPQILSLIPISRSAWWAGIREGKFPQGIKLGSKTTVWRAEDIRNLIERSR